MKILPIIITAAALLSSCEKSAQKTNETASSATKTTEATPADAAPTATAANATVNSADSAKPALNPAHGEPYHRCDIAVGAPIDSQPVAQNAAPQMPQQTAPANSFNTNPIAPSNSPSAAPATATGPKPALNPAHGEPHHRCDLQVGAPLS